MDKPSGESTGKGEVIREEDFSTLARKYGNQGRDDKAAELYRRILAIREKEYGSGHPETAMVLNNLAYFLAQQGDFAAAEQLLKRALNIREKGLGPDHELTAFSRANLGYLYSGLEDYEKAEPLLEQALMIREKVPGLGHPESLQNLNELIKVLGKNKSFAKLGMLAERINIEAKKLFDAESPVLAALNKIKDHCRKMAESEKGSE